MFSTRQPRCSACSKVDVRRLRSYPVLRISEIYFVRKAIATKASKAAALARKRKAKERRAKTGEKIPAEQRRQGAKKATKARSRKDKKTCEAATQSAPAQPTSDDTDSALVTSELVEGVHLAMERNMILPFELHVIGADDLGSCARKTAKDCHGCATWLLAIPS